LLRPYLKNICGNLHDCAVPLLWSAIPLLRRAILETGEYDIGGVLRHLAKMRSHRWLLVLATAFAYGCATLPQPVQTFRPPEHGEARGKLVNGDYFVAHVGVANFGEAPKAVLPIKPESRVNPVPDVAPAPAEVERRIPAAEKPAESASDEPGIERKSNGEYDFTVRNVAAGIEPFLKDPSSVPSTYDVTAFNHGFAPVTVSIAIDQKASDNIITNKTFPLTAVLQPKSTQVLTAIRPRIKNQESYVRSAYSWSIGDYRARHHCPEHYQIPFAGKVQAYASVNGNAKASAFARHAIIFAVPPGTRVRAARKGTVVLVRKGKVDILHDDLTVATYAHLGQIRKDIAEGKAVSTEDVLGEVGPNADKSEGFVQLAVWRPEARPLASSEPSFRQIDFDLVSFPLRFCSSTFSECRVLTRDQLVSRSQKPVTAKRREVKKTALRD